MSRKSLSTSFFYFHNCTLEMCGMCTLYKTRARLPVSGRSSNHIRPRGTDLLYVSDGMSAHRIGGEIQHIPTMIDQMSICLCHQEPLLISSRVSSVDI